MSLLPSVSLLVIRGRLTPGMGGKKYTEKIRRTGLAPLTSSPSPMETRWLVLSSSKADRQARDGGAPFSLYYSIPPSNSLHPITRRKGRLSYTAGGIPNSLSRTFVLYLQTCLFHHAFTSLQLTAGDAHCIFLTTPEMLGASPSFRLSHEYHYAIPSRSPPSLLYPGDQVTSSACFLLWC